MFAVGDEKQSIYSFQGAEPEMFAATGASVRGRRRAARPRLAQRAADAVVPHRRAAARRRRPRVRRSRSARRDCRPAASRIRHLALRSATPAASRSVADREARRGARRRRLAAARRDAAVTAPAARLAERIADTIARLARRGRAARLAGPAGPRRRHPDPGAPAPSVRRPDGGRAEGRARSRSPAPTGCGSPSRSRCRT